MPDIIRAFQRAREVDVALKHTVLTGSDDSILTEPSPEGSEARRLALQHFKQSLSRQGKMYNYLGVAESHRFKRVHSHLLGIISYIAHCPAAVFSGDATPGVLGVGSLDFNSQLRSGAFSQPGTPPTPPSAAVSPSPMRWA